MRRIIHHAKHHITRITNKSRHHLKCRRTKFFIVIVIANLLFGMQIWCNYRSFPNTYIGSMPLGMSSRQNISTRLNHLMTVKRNFDIRGRVYQYSYEDLGVYLNPDDTVSLIWAPNNKLFPGNVFGFLQSWTKRTIIEPELYYTESYTAFIDKTIYDFSEGTDIMYLDQPNKTIGYIEQTERYGLDPFALQVILSESLGSPTKTIRAPIIPIDNKIRQTVEQTNTKLSRAYENPLTIIIGSGETHQFFTLTRQALKASTIASVSAERTTVAFAVDRDKLDMYIAPLFATLGARVIDKTATSTIIANSVKRVLSKRFSGIHADSVGVSLDNSPNTEGTLADRYIEVDISQQKLYTFADGQLVKAYRVSTGKDYPTPTGEFTILNKTGLGFSNIYDVWMPWWMGFSYSEELNAYFGIHELPYAESAGTRISRPRDSIGSPSTGGCVALDVGEAKEVYQFADIGTKVVIYQ